MKKPTTLFTLLSIFSFAFLLISCGDSTGSSNAPELVTQIVARSIADAPEGAVTAKIIAPCGDDLSEVVVAEAPFDHNSVTIDLPEAPPSHCLTTPNELMDELMDEESDNYSVSDGEAKLFYFAKITAFDADDNEIGVFGRFALDSSSATNAFWAYSDREVLISGKDTLLIPFFQMEFINIFDLHLKEGWNLLYNTSKGGLDFEREVVYTVNTFTTAKPKASLQWGFEPEDEEDNDFWAAPASGGTAKIPAKSLLSTAKKLKALR